VPNAAPPLNKGVCMELAMAMDADENGHITVVELKAAFPKGHSFAQCVALILAKDGTLTLPMPPAKFLGRGAHLDAVGPGSYTHHVILHVLVPRLLN